MSGSLSSLNSLLTALHSNATTEGCTRRRVIGESLRNSSVPMIWSHDSDTRGRREHASQPYPNVRPVGLQQVQTGSCEPCDAGVSAATSVLRGSRHDPANVLGGDTLGSSSVSASISAQIEALIGLASWLRLGLARPTTGTGRLEGCGGVMELVVVAFALPDVAQRGEVRVSHVRAGLERGLELGEDVVVHCVDGEFLAATVIGLEFELDDTLYHLELGVRLPLDDAAVRLGAEPVDPADCRRPITVQDVLDHLDELRHVSRGSTTENRSD